MKNQNPSDFLEIITLHLRNELNWFIKPSQLKLVTNGFANFVYHLTVENQGYYVKLFPEHFRVNQLVAKPEGSFFRENWVYALTQHSDVKYVAELIHAAPSPPLIITREWGRILLFDSINSLRTDQLLLQIKSVLRAASEFKKIISGNNYFRETEDFISNFTFLQREYLIKNPLSLICSDKSISDQFWEDYMSLRHEIILGDLSLKNILVNNAEVRFCDFESIFLGPDIFDTCYFLADILHKLNRNKHRELLTAMQVNLVHELPPAEQNIFFRLLAVCISYRNSNKLQASFLGTMDQNEIVDIFFL